MCVLAMRLRESAFADGCHPKLFAGFSVERDDALALELLVGGRQEDLISDDRWR